MRMLTICNLDDNLKAQLRIHTAQHSCSMEEEVRRIFQKMLTLQNARKGFGTRIHQRVVAITGNTELALPKRSLPRATPDFSGNNIAEAHFPPNLTLLNPWEYPV